MWPAALLKRAAEQGNVGLVRQQLLVLSTVAVATLALIGWSFMSLNVRWDTNAYGSLVWMLIGTHVVALTAAALILWVLTIYMYTGVIEGRRFMNVYESGDYWLLAVFLWLAAWAVVYVAPRVL
jgi:heme/copper-type cytochrome/quinol oxidase subunit 3